MIFCTDTHFINESSNGFILNWIPFTKGLIIKTITNKSVRTELYQNNSHFVYKGQSPDSGEVIDSADCNEQDLNIVVNWPSSV